MSMRFGRYILSSEVWQFNLKPSHMMLIITLHLHVLMKISMLHTANNSAQTNNQPVSTIQ
jgi:hypothetical protein